MRLARHAGLDPASMNTGIRILDAATGNCEWIMEREPCVYILASRRHGTLYTGVTSNLFLRLWQHRNEITKGFTSRYAVWRLVWFEMHGDMDSAITREKRIKNWKRDWKIQLIEGENPDWHDLAIGFGFKPVTDRHDEE